MSRTEKLSRRWAWIGLVSGLVMGFADIVVLYLAGIRMDLNGRDATVGVGLFFASTFAGLGYLIGLLAEARSRLRADAATISAQLRELERTQRQVLEYEKLAAIGRLSAGVAHEVRNPLGVIRASAGHIAEGLGSAEEDLRRACTFIREEVDRLDGFIRALLDFARPIRPALQAVTLAAIVDRVERLASDRLAARSIELGRSLDGTLELEADPDLVAQILLGLVVNACEAAPEGGTVLLRGRATGTELHVEVADDGPGVAPSEREQLFEPFFTTKPTGTGLGLAMATRIAAAHGGGIEVVDASGAGAQGAGACFRLRLPRVGPSRASEAA